MAAPSIAMAVLGRNHKVSRVSERGGWRRRSSDRGRPVPATIYGRLVFANSATSSGMSRAIRHHVVSQFLVRRLVARPASAVGARQPDRLRAVVFVEQATVIEHYYDLPSDPELATTT